MPLGNGNTGSLVYGSNPLKITVDRTDLWDLRPNEVTLEKGFNFKNLVKLSMSGKDEDWKERERLFEDIFMGKPYPSKITAGHIELWFDKSIKNIYYSLDLNEAIVRIYADNRYIAEVFVFDEPTIGLHPKDVETLLKVFATLIENGATVIVIEHDLDVIRNADYIIDMGPEGGEAGGEIIFAGTLKELKKCKISKTAKFI